MRRLLHMPGSPRSDLELATMLLSYLQKWGHSEPVSKYNVIGQGSLPGTLESNSHIRLSEEEKSTLVWIWDRFTQNRYLSIAHSDRLAKLSERGLIATESDLIHLIHSQEATMSKLDGLTGLPGKDDLSVRLKILASQANASHPLGLIYFDLDHFKQLNDRSGHEAGDKILAFTAAAIRVAVAGTGEAFRWGGDEFVVLLPNHNLDVSANVAEKIRKEIERLCLEGKSAGVTTSMGVSCLPETTSNTEDIVGQADRAMYASKQGGKNRVTCSDRN
jgi:diguanylate cyclase (GGDEF)-like protein